jgi:hypothetical protein
MFSNVIFRTILRLALPGGTPFRRGGCGEVGVESCASKGA